MSLPPAGAAIDVSVLVPAKDEAENLPELLRLTAEAFRGQAPSFEVVVIDDGSVDDTPAVLRRLAAQYDFLRPVAHRSQRGIAEALRTGWLNARGRVLVFYPADLQFMPADIPRLVAPILAGEADIVTGYKMGYYEKAFVSRVYNGLSRLLFDVPVRDLNSVKAYRREIMDALPGRADWHRYMVVVAAAQGFSVAEIPVAVLPRRAGRSKFGIGRIPVGVLDMLAVWFELRFGQKPLLLFGMAGALLFATGFATGIVAIGIRVFAGVGYRPLLTLVETCLILGSILFATGLLGEQIAQQRAELREMRRELDGLRPPGAGA